MKTQLLEDIGQSAGLPPAPPAAAAHAKAQASAQGPARVVKAEPAKRSPAGGVWRKKPAVEPPAATAEQLEEPAPVALDKVFEEIAALEAQFVQPGEPAAPSVAQAEPGQDVSAAPAELPPAPVSLPQEETTAPNPIQSVAAPHGPLFYFTEPLPAAHEARPPAPAPTTRARPKRNYLLGTACALLVGLLVLGGRWLSQDRNDAAPVVPIAAQTKAQPRVETRPEPAVLADTPAPAIPPLVMLEPDPPAAVKPERARPSVARAREERIAQKPEQAAQRVTLVPSPTPSVRKARAPSRIPNRPAKELPERVTVRQLARASADPPVRPAATDTSMEATLRACREHGYHAMQCIRRECSVTAYGFACRGR